MSDRGEVSAGSRLKVSLFFIALMLAGTGCVYVAGDNQISTADEGIPSVLKYARQYQKEEGYWDKDSQIAELTTALDGSRKQRDDLNRKAEEAQKSLNQQIIALKQQLARADSGDKDTTKQMEKEKARLVSSLNALKKEMPEMPVVTPEMLKTESVQLMYTAGVMLGRDTGCAEPAGVTE